MKVLASGLVQIKEVVEALKPIFPSRITIFKRDTIVSSTEAGDVLIFVLVPYKQDGIQEEAQPPKKKAT